MKHLKEVAVVYPTYNPRDDDKGGIRDVDRLRQWAEAAGKLHVLAQGKDIPRGTLPDEVVVHHFPDPLGLWGVQYHALQGSLKDALEDDGLPYILVVLQHTWQLAQGEALINLLTERDANNAFGWRADMAAALSENPDVGFARTLGECWLAAAGLLTLDVKPGVVLDGFSSILAFKRETYLDPKRWRWTKSGTVDWGGGWMNQAIALEENADIIGKVFNLARRQAPSQTFTGKPQEAWNGMMDKVAENEFFATRVRQHHYEDAAKRIKEFFPEQPCFVERSSAELAEIIRSFNPTLHP